MKGCWTQLVHFGTFFLPKNGVLCQASQDGHTQGSPPPQKLARNATGIARRARMMRDPFLELALSAQHLSRLVNKRDERPSPVTTEAVFLWLQAFYNDGRDVVERSSGAAKVAKGLV